MVGPHDIIHMDVIIVLAGSISQTIRFNPWILFPERVVVSLIGFGGCPQ